MNLLRFDSEEAWAEGVAGLWRDRLRTNPRLRMCLPSGHTPNPVYAAMARSVKAGQVSFREAEIFALDDYGGLAPADPGKCVNMLHRFLLDLIDLPAARFHFIDVDAPDLDRVCRGYESLIVERGGFDLTLLGIGLNGHLGLNEPGSERDALTRRVEMHPMTVSSSAGYLTHSRLPTWGVGVGLRQLLASREVWLLANGARKAEILRRACTGAVTSEVPASLLREHANAWCIVDAAAGAGLVAG